MNSLQYENHDHIQSSPLVSRVTQRTRTIAMREKIPRHHGTEKVLWKGGIYITSGTYIAQDFNSFDFRKLGNTKDVRFCIYDDISQSYKDLEFPEKISVKLGEYFRNRQEIESDEGYRLPGGFRDTPVNCQSFVYYIQGWFENRPKRVGMEYIRNQEDEAKVQPGDVLYLCAGDEGTGETWHYLIYIGQGFCISKDGKSHLIVTRHHLRGMYRVVPEFS